MAQSGYTPILIYASGTATNTPSAANLTSGSTGAELAINYTDGKLFYKDNSGNVQVIASKATTGGTFPAVVATETITGSLTAGAFSYGTLGYSDVNIFGSFTSSVNTYNQIILQNTNSGTAASTDFVVSNNNGTATTYYGDFGMNSSGFSGTGALGAANNVYVTSTSADLAIGTTTSNAIHFVINGSATDAMTINTSGALALNGLYGTSGYLLQTAGSGGAPTWVAQSTITAGNVSGTVSVANGGLGITTTPSNGYIPIGNGTNYVSAALTAGAGVSITNGSGSVTIAATGTTINSQTSAYTLVASDAGKTISITTGGVTIPNSIMSAGNMVTIYNNSGSNQTITQGSGLTLQWTGQSSSTTGNRTLGLYGVCTVLFITSSSAIISGSGLT